MPGEKKLKPLILKNLDSHSLKNLNANLLYSITICFLVFQTANFKALNIYLVAGVAGLLGGDISLFSLEISAKPKFEELKILPILDNL